MAVAEIIDTMERLADAHDQLLRSGQEKKRAVIQKDMDSLMQVMRSEAKLAKDISELDNTRILITKRLMVDMGIKSRLYASHKNLMGVVFDPDDRVRLQSSHERLSKTLRELKQLNDLNQTLLQQSLEFIQFSLELMIMPEDESYTYKNPTMSANQHGQSNSYYNKA
ncbi:flagellar protein FlgN [Paenibacillus sp. NPDC058071]|uniref:flagellar protein FlgN n=1 Tax=Paenibacillus sp. NPDC058071 TaxID=3346326 RepID=UPI0036DC1443